MIKNRIKAAVGGSVLALWATAGLAAPGMEQANVGDQSGNQYLAGRMSTIEKQIKQMNKRVPIHVGVGFESLYQYQNYNKSNEKQGGSAFTNKIEVYASGDFDNGLYYGSRFDYQVSTQLFFPAWMYVGYNFSKHFTLRGGVINQPLGAGVDGSYYDNSYLSDATLWLGYENNPDIGIKGIYKTRNVELVASFMKNPETTSAGARFRPDQIYGNSTTTTVNGVSGNFASNARPDNILGGGGAYTFHLDNGGSAQLGANGQFSSLYNNLRNSYEGDQWATAAFVNYKQGNFGATLQWMGFTRNVKNGDSTFNGNNLSDSVLLSDGRIVAAKGQIYSTRLSYTHPIAVGPFKAIVFYDDYDFVKSGSNDQFTSNNSQFNLLGAHISTGHFNIYLEDVLGKNAAFANVNSGQYNNKWENTVSLAVTLAF
jgi:hypothetical protein